VRESKGLVEPRTDLEVGPEVTLVVAFSSVITDELHGVVLRDILRILPDKVYKSSFVSANDRRCHIVLTYL
jgi:hypothetical protein